MKRWLLVLVLLAACSSSKGAQSTTTVDPDMPPQSATVACQDAVRAHLKSPGSAVFDKDHPPLSAAQGPSYIVRGVVDSENGFGALLRNRYACTVGPGSLTHRSEEWIADATLSPG